MLDCRSGFALLAALSFQSAASPQSPPATHSPACFGTPDMPGFEAAPAGLSGAASSVSEPRHDQDMESQYATCTSRHPEGGAALQPDHPACWAWAGGPSQGLQGAPSGGAAEGTCGGTRGEDGGACRTLLLATVSGVVHRVLVHLRAGGGGASLELQVLARDATLPLVCHRLMAGNVLLLDRACDYERHTSLLAGLTSHVLQRMAANLSGTRWVACVCCN